VTSSLHMLPSNSSHLDCLKIPELASGHGKHMHGEVVRAALLPSKLILP
jgi:hypothetical protein